MRHRYIVMMKRPYGWVQCGPTYITLESAKAGASEAKRGPDIDATVRIFIEVE